MYEKSDNNFLTWLVFIAMALAALALAERDSLQDKLDACADGDRVACQG